MRCGPETLRGWTGESFDLDPVIHLARMAEASYLARDKFRLVAEAAGYDSADLLSAGSAQAGAARRGDAITIALRGTDGWGDALADLQSAWRVNWRGVLPRGAKIGWGIKRQAKAILPELVRWILAQDVDEPQIYLVGHSLGGGYAPPVACGLASEGIACRVVVPLEAPRPGGRKFRDFFEGAPILVDEGMRDALPTWGELYGVPRPRSWSVVNRHKGVVDPITRVPMQWWGFRHAPGGRRVLLGDHGWVHGREEWQRYRSAHPYSTPVAGWRLASRLWIWGKRGLRAHSARRVAEKLERLRGLRDAPGMIGGAVKVGADEEARGKAPTYSLETICDTFESIRRRQDRKEMEKLIADATRRIAP